MKTWPLSPSHWDSDLEQSKRQLPKLAFVPEKGHNPDRPVPPGDTFKRLSKSVLVEQHWPLFSHKKQKKTWTSCLTIIIFFSWFSVWAYDLWAAFFSWFSVQVYELLAPFCVCFLTIPQLCHIRFTLYYSDPGTTIADWDRPACTSIIITCSTCHRHGESTNHYRSSAPGAVINHAVVL